MYRPLHYVFDVLKLLTPIICLGHCHISSREYADRLFSYYHSSNRCLVRLSFLKLLTYFHLVTARSSISNFVEFRLSNGHNIPNVNEKDSTRSV